MFMLFFSAKLWSRSGPEILEIPVWWPNTPRARFLFKYPETIVFGKNIDSENKTYNLI